MTTQENKKQIKFTKNEKELIFNYFRENTGILLPIVWRMEEGEPDLILMTKVSGRGFQMKVAFGKETKRIDVFFNDYPIYNFGKAKSSLQFIENVRSISTECMTYWVPPVGQGPKLTALFMLFIAPIISYPHLEQMIFGDVLNLTGIRNVILPILQKIGLGLSAPLEIALFAHCLESLIAVFILFNYQPALSLSVVLSWSMNSFLVGFPVLLKLLRLRTFVLKSRRTLDIMKKDE